MSSEAQAQSITLRQAVPDDLARIMFIRRSAAENPEDPLRPMPAEWRLAAIARGACWVCCVDNVIGGFVQTGSNPPMIGGLFVHPDFEGRGIGRKLLRLAVARLRSSGASEIWLSTLPDTRAAQLYESEGWLRSGGADPEVSFVLATAQQQPE